MKIDELIKKIQSGDRTALAQSITLVESQLPTDWEKAKQLLTALGANENISRRLGFSGPPGVGKSTFIEKLGLELIKKKQKVAVLAVDPSSEITGGSILGDKTRMEELSRHQNSFVRPSPTRGHLGGVTSSLPGVIRLCEEAGFDWILIESVGVGQSEIELSRMVDQFILLAQPGAGDELQGIKKGILEYCDLIVVNKADRDSTQVNATKQQLLAAIKIMRQNPVSVFAASALKSQGISEILTHLEDVFKNFDFTKRKDFSIFWFESLLISEFKKMLQTDGNMKKHIESLKKEIAEKKLMPVEAADQFYRQLTAKLSK